MKPEAGYKDPSKPKLNKGQLSITFEHSHDSDSEQSNTSELLRNENDLKTGTHILNRNESRNKLRKTDGTNRTNIARPKPLIDLRRNDSSGVNRSHRNNYSNVFGYTPYDTGAVKSDFTTMINSIPAQSSLLNSQVKPANNRASPRKKVSCFNINTRSPKSGGDKDSLSSATVQ